MKLRGVIDGYSLPLGTTETGKAWCLKALHPADPLVEVKGVPDESAVPTVFVNYQTIQVLAPPSGTTDATWNGVLSVVPHPVCFGSYRVVDSSATHSAVGVHNNSQLTGVAHAAKFQSFRDDAVRWRMAYMSVTVVQDGADLTNQGTIVAAQKIVSPLMGNVTTLTTNPGTGAMNSCYAYPHVAIFAPADIPLYENIQSMPNSYFNRSKEGLYMPLKLTRTHQNWRSAGDSIQVTMGVPHTGPNWAGGGVTAIPAVATAEWPFTDLQTCGYTTSGDITSNLCNDIWGDVAWKNVAVSTSLRVFYRVGFELQVLPGTGLTPFQSLSPKYDPMALADYFAISRELKDAYPENFNSLGKIWDQISSVLGTIAPVASMIPGFGGLVGGAVGGVKSIGDLIRKATRNGKGENPSLADVEAGQKAVQAIQSRATASAIKETRKRVGASGKKGGKAKTKPKKKAPVGKATAVAAGNFLNQLLKGNRNRK